MKQLLLAAALFAASSPAALAACTATVVGNVTWLQGMDHQCDDRDDLSSFVDRIPTATANVNLSLGKNDNAFNNIMVSSTGGGFVSDGNGFANLKSENQGNKPADNTLTDFTFTPGTSTMTADGQAFPGFDGALVRGQLDAMTGLTYNNTMTVTVDFVGGGSASHTFHDVSEADIGALGFDETAGFAFKVASVDFSLAGTGGAWNQVKQMDFSVPGAVGTIPEPSTWMMMIAGFGLLSGIGWRRRIRQSRFALR
jgi:hypothetical protein